MSSVGLELQHFWHSPHDVACSALALPSPQLERERALLSPLGHFVAPPPPPPRDPYPPRACMQSQQVEIDRRWRMDQRMRVMEGVRGEKQRRKSYKEFTKHAIHFPSLTVAEGRGMLLGARERSRIIAHLCLPSLILGESNHRSRSLPLECNSSLVFALLTGG